MASRSLKKTSGGLASSMKAHFQARRDTIHGHSMTVNRRVRDHLCFLGVWPRFSFRRHCTADWVLAFRARQRHLRYRIQAPLATPSLVRCSLHWLAIDLIMWFLGSIMWFVVAGCMSQFFASVAPQVHSTTDSSSVDWLEPVSLSIQPVSWPAPQTQYCWEPVAESATTTTKHESSSSCIAAEEFAPKAFLSGCPRAHLRFISSSSFPP